MSDRFHAAQQWRLRALGGMFGVFALAAAGGAVALELWPALASAALLGVAAVLLVVLGGRLPRAAAGLAARRSAFLLVAGAVACVALAVVVWAVAVTGSDGVDADAERVRVPDGGSVELDGREISVELEGDQARVLVTEVATGIVMSDLVLDEGDRNGGDDWGRLLVTEIADDGVELAREQG